MNVSESLRTDLIVQLERAYLDLLGQVNFLFDAISFYVERYPADSESDDLIHREIFQTVDLLTNAITALATSIVDLKSNKPRKITKVNLQLEVMNEIWAGSQALLYFLISNHVCVEKFNLDKAADAFKRLCASNKALP